ncbi:Tetratricopeptide repeat protein 39C [Exaiptasia diaphana]|nr:Tetratricopeptide repeat protein 39C [Exaiptasia diaphana]
MAQAAQYKKVEPSEDDCLLLALELLYVWRAFYTCTETVLHKMLKDMQECNPSPNLIPLKTLMIGSVNQILKNNDLAVKYFQEAIYKSGRSPPDSHVPPFATYELGVLYAQDTRTSDKGEELLRRVKDHYSGYDFENRLSFRVHSAMARIEERRQEMAASLHKKA